MVDRDVNPVEQRHIVLSARFKAAWAFHQLLIGMQRMNIGGDFENRSESFQGLFTRLREFSESLHGPTNGSDRLESQLASLERQIDDLCNSMVEQEGSISPSELRRFFTQVRALDDRILIEVVRFYLEIHRQTEWHQDRLDKIDFLLSRLAEKIAGSDLQGDRTRLEKVLQGLLSSAGPQEIPDKELESLISTLQDLRSEVRWVKTFDELSESSLVEIYRALKRDMAGRMFHPKLLPLVVEVNNSFRRKIDELRSLEETRLLNEYQQLSELQQRSDTHTADLQAELQILQEQVEQFRHQAKSDNVRLGDLAQLGESLRDLTTRLEMQTPGPESDFEAVQGIPPMPWSGGKSHRRTGLMPDLDSLQPHWSELLKALSGYGQEITAEQAQSESSLAAFRLQDREITAFRRTVGSQPANVGVEQFILAAASLRHRICQAVEELRGMQSRVPGAIPELVTREARETIRMADAYVKHFSHLSDQAVFDNDAEEARDYQILRTRLTRELSGLMVLLLQLAPEPPKGRALSRETEPFGELAES